MVNKKRLEAKGMHELVVRSEYRGHVYEQIANEILEKLDK